MRESHTLLAILLGATAAGATWLGGFLIARRDWSREYLKYFVALGAGFMLGVAFLEMIPESVHLAGDASFLFVLGGYLLVHFFEHTLAPHFHFGEETHVEEMAEHHVGFIALGGLMIHAFFDGVAIASGFLISSWLGVVIFVAVLLHKLPEGFTVASLMLASGQSRRSFRARTRPGPSHGGSPRRPYWCGVPPCARAGNAAVRLPRYSSTPAHPAEAAAAVFPECW